MLIIEHINRAIPTSGHTPMYVMHKFFARKQEDVIREYINTYSNEGEKMSGFLKLQKYKVFVMKYCIVLPFLKHHWNWSIFKRMVVFSGGN